MSLKIYITFDEKFGGSLSCISYLEGGWKPWILQDSQDSKKKIWQTKENFSFPIK